MIEDERKILLNAIAINRDSVVGLKVRYLEKIYSEYPNPRPATANIVLADERSCGCVIIRVEMTQPKYLAGTHVILNIKNCGVPNRWDRRDKFSHDDHLLIDKIWVARR